MRERTKLLKSGETTDLSGLNQPFRRQGGKSAKPPTIDLDEAFPRHNPGPWPKGFTVSREEIYDETGR